MKKLKISFIYTFVLIAFLIFVTAGCSKNNDTTTIVGPVPVITTSSVTNITATTATCGGNITSNGVPVLFCGVCWSASQNPTIINSKTIDSVASGSFISVLNGLLTNTTYYVRAYATNINGTGYGNVATFTTPLVVTDIDGNIYHTTTIGTQIWTVENLRTTKYNDGSVIPFVNDNLTWTQLTTAAYCWPGNDQITYGALYNWAAVNSGKLAPAGWHVPSRNDWMTLASFLGGFNNAGGHLKETGTQHWNAPNIGATNDYGFTALPGGYRSIVSGDYINIGNQSCWWSSTGTIDSCLHMTIYNTSAQLLYQMLNKNFGMSVRCIKN